MHVLHCVCIMNDYSWVLSGYTKKKKKTGKSPDSPGEDTLLLYDGEPNNKKKEAFHLWFFLECSVYV